MQNTYGDLKSIRRISSTFRQPDGFDISTITQISAAIVVLAIASTAAVLTAVFLTANTLKNLGTNSSLTTTTITTVSTTASRPVFTLSQTISGQTVTCSGVINTNGLFTECDDLKQGGLYAPNGVSCASGWYSTASPYWSSLAFCQAFLSSRNTYHEIFYDCNTSQPRFTWSSGGVWGTTNDNGYTKSLRCYY